MFVVRCHAYMFSHSGLHATVRKFSEEANIMMHVLHFSTFITTTLTCQDIDEVENYQTIFLTPYYNVWDNENKNPNTSNHNRTGTQGTIQIGGAADKITWTTVLLWYNSWTQNKKRSYKIEYKRKEPTGFRAWTRTRMVVYQARELSNLD